MTTDDSRARQGLRTFSLIWGGQVVSLLGTSLGSFVPGVWVYERTGSVTRFSLMVLASGIATLLVTPLAGSVADRLCEPLFAAFGPLAGSAAGRLLGTGPGRGIGVGVLFLVRGVILVVTTLLASADLRLRRVESELPDPPLAGANGLEVAA